MKRHSDELMQAVLDGEATPGEARELDQRLAADPAARAHYEELRGLFDDLHRVPKAYPPEGLVASVLANIPQNPAARRSERQLFVAPGVIEASSRNAGSETPGRSKGMRQIYQRWAFSRGRDMSEQKGGLGGLGNRKIWIGGGVAVAAAIVVAATGLFPPNANETAGTIAPAQRYQATPISAGDVKLGTQEGGGASGMPGGGDTGTANAASANEGHGNLGAGDEGHGNEGHGNLGHGNEGHGNEGHGNLGHGNEGHGNLGHGNLGAGNEGHGNLGHGNLGAGNNAQVQ
ncbi:MAG TPA: hypothetical protein VF304_13650 [Casimicrobiaceae bacterium]